MLDFSPEQLLYIVDFQAALATFDLHVTPDIVYKPCHILFLTDTDNSSAVVRAFLNLQDSLGIGTFQDQRKIADRFFRAQPEADGGRAYD